MHLLLVILTILCKYTANMRCYLTEFYEIIVSFVWQCLHVAASLTFIYISDFVIVMNISVLFDMGIVSHDHDLWDWFWDGRVSAVENNIYCSRDQVNILCILCLFIILSTHTYFTAILMPPRSSFSILELICYLGTPMCRFNTSN